MHSGLWDPSGRAPCVGPSTWRGCLSSCQISCRPKVLCPLAWFRSRGRAAQSSFLLISTCRPFTRRRGFPSVRPQPLPPLV